MFHDRVWPGPAPPLVVWLPILSHLFKEAASAVTISPYCTVKYPLYWVIPHPIYKNKNKVSSLYSTCRVCRALPYNKVQKCVNTISTPPLASTPTRLFLHLSPKLDLIGVTNDFHIAKYNDRASVFLLLYL